MQNPQNRRWKTAKAEAVTTLEPAIIAERIGISTILNTHRLPINVVYLCSAITFPQKSISRGKQHLNTALFERTDCLFATSLS